MSETIDPRCACVNCGKLATNLCSWAPGEVLIKCLGSYTSGIFACSLSCAETWGRSSLHEGSRPGEPGWKISITGGIKVYLDDLRDEPEGWHRTYTVPETIELLKQGVVTELSLDNDLGNRTVRLHEEGWHVLEWIEETVFHNPSWKVPKIYIHTGNWVARDRMLSILQSIERLKTQETPSE